MIASAPVVVPVLRSLSRRRPLFGQRLGAAALVLTWLFLWSWFGLGVLEPLSRLPLAS